MGRMQGKLEFSHEKRQASQYVHQLWILAPTRVMYGYNVALSHLTSMLRVDHSGPQIAAATTMGTSSMTEM